MRWKRVFKLMAWLVGLGLVVSLAAVEGIYRTALARVPALPQKATGPVTPESWNRVAWTHSEQRAPLRVQPVWPHTVILTLAKGMLSEPQPRNASRDLSPLGFRLAGLVARLWSHRLAEESKRAPGVLEQWALTVWLTRHWSAEDLLAFKAHNLWFGGRLFGVSAAAPALLNKDVAQVDISDVALLLATSEKAWDVECSLERLQRRRDALLDGLATAGMATQAEAEAARSAPLPLAVTSQAASCR